MQKKTILITMGAVVALCVFAQLFALNDASIDPNTDSKLQQFSRDISRV